MTMMDSETKTSVSRRLASAAGHLKGIERMVNEDAYCIDVIRQLQAVQAAMNKVSAIMLDSHLNSCVISAIQSEDPSERTRVLEEISSVFEVSSKA
jgi:DNA-binding FrmR family transcriptional regulator